MTHGKNDDTRSPSPVSASATGSPRSPQPKGSRLVKTACTCERCQSACQNTPGWFRPGEAEKAAALVGVSLPVFFRRSLAIQWWENDDDTATFALAPALVGAQPGLEYPANPRGVCVFFQAGRCAIHAAKPFDCAYGNPHDERTEARTALDVAARARTVALWAKQQAQIRRLLGRTPKAAPFSIFDYFASMFDFR